MEIQRFLESITEHKAFLYAGGLAGVVLFFVARGLGSRVMAARGYSRLFSRGGRLHEYRF